ncbi:hypothetical protein H6P81_008259 [Aristolochia fimbriata]|uniref:EamA domain-containing protein n=1 Tax=Aristolochia fimbriata TaxID=158543 RepID=A0AAV7F2I7_ARIFI|nr:hypothetical protein H6P81_008259 [Aristolochia fimbriata]
MMMSSEAKSVAAMVAVNVAFALGDLLIKKVLEEGTAVMVFVTYRLIVAFIFLTPIALLLERRIRPKFTPRIFFYLFFSALYGVTLNQYLFMLGLRYTTATFTSAFFNMMPVATFIMALPFRLETVNLRSTGGRAKILGIVVSVGGAMLLTLYKGVALINPNSTSKKNAAVGAGKVPKNWTIGTMALVGACLSGSSWYLIQAKISNIYPASYSSTALMSFLSAIQSGILGLSTERKLALWGFKGKLEILGVLYTGIVGSGLCFVLMSWCVKERGPVFTAAFNPLTQIVVAIFESSIFHEPLHLGSLLGSALVILGLYMLLWGKSKETTLAPTKPRNNSKELVSTLNRSSRLPYTSKHISAIFKLQKLMKTMPRAVRSTCLSVINLTSWDTCRWRILSSPSSLGRVEKYEFVKEEGVSVEEEVTKQICKQIVQAKLKDHGCKHKRKYFSKSTDENKRIISSRV